MNIRAASSLVSRYMSTQPVVAKGFIPKSAGYQKLVKQQILFVENDGKYVWQKLSTDGMLFQASAALVALGSLLAANSLYQMFYPRKNN